MAIESDLCHASKKKKYATKSEAEYAIEYLRKTKRTPSDLHSYECPYCQCWHMTSKSTDSTPSAPQYLKHPKSRKQR